MRDPNWVPPHVREQQFRRSVRRTSTIILCLAVGIPLGLIAWKASSTTVAVLIPIILLVIAAITVRSGGANNRQYINDTLNELNRRSSKPPST